MNSRDTMMVVLAALIVIAVVVALAKGRGLKVKLGNWLGADVKADDKPGRISVADRAVIENAKIGGVYGESGQSPGEGADRPMDISVLSGAAIRGSAIDTIAGKIVDGKVDQGTPAPRPKP
jgi:hypothetical protein